MDNKKEIFIKKTIGDKIIIIFKEKKNFKINNFLNYFIIFVSKIK